MSVRDGDELVKYLPGVGATATVQDRVERALALPELWWRPRQMIGAIEIESVTEASMLDRPCWQFEATRDLVRDPMMQTMMPGDRFELWVDQASGVVLRCDEWFAGAELASTEWVEFELLDRIDEAVFDHALPAGVVVRSEAEVVLDRARALGVDLSEVDTSDAQQIARAVHQRSRPRLLDHHIATDGPPSVAAAADARIREAFAGLSEEDGESLPNVEAGDGLAPTVRSAAERFAADGAEIAVREIKFPGHFGGTELDLTDPECASLKYRRSFSGGSLWREVHRGEAQAGIDAGERRGTQRTQTARDRPDTWYGRGRRGPQRAAAEPIGDDRGFHHPGVHEWSGLSHGPVVAGARRSRTGASARYGVSVSGV